MFAPRRVPPCFTDSVAPLKTSMKLTGPLATPPVEPTMSPPGRRRENAKPGPAAGLVDERRSLDAFEDAVHRVLDGQHVAGRILEAVALASVHERGRVREEFQVAMAW